MLLDSSFTINNGWSINIKDNDFGLNEKFTDRIFIPLERLHGMSDYEGTGIGLAICKKNYISPWWIYLCEKSGGAGVYLHLA